MKERNTRQIYELRTKAEGWIEWGFMVDFVDQFGTYMTIKKTHTPLQFDITKWNGEKETWGLGKFTVIMNMWLQNPSTNLQIHKEETL